MARTATGKVAVMTNIMGQPTAWMKVSSTQRQCEVQVVWPVRERPDADAVSHRLTHYAANIGLRLITHRFELAFQLGRHPAHQPQLRVRADLANLRHGACVDTVFSNG